MTQEAILYILEKEHPHIVQAIHTRLQTLLPAFVFTDYGHLRDIIRFYCDYHGLKVEDMQGTCKNRQTMNHRKELITLILLCYQPEKLYGLSKRPGKHKLLTLLATLLECSRSSISYCLPEILFYFEKSEKFRAPILAVHGALLKTYTTQDV